MKVLVACELSGVVREAFRAKGHDAWSCDILPSDDNSDHHFQCDVRQVLTDDWDLMIGHPPCTYLANSGVHWLHNKYKGNDPIEFEAEVVRVGRRWLNLEAGVRLFQLLQSAPIKRICIENPVPHKYAVDYIGKPDQYIQPYEYGHDASKRTGLWLKGLEKLVPTNDVRRPKGEYYANQTPSGQNKLGPSAERAKIRSKTYEGIAAAMAEQWG